MEKKTATPYKPKGPFEVSIDLHGLTHDLEKKSIGEVLAGTVLNLCLMANDHLTGNRHAKGDTHGRNNRKR